MHIVQPVVEAEPGVLEPAAAVGAALVPQRFQQPPLLLGVRRDHPALARRHLLVRIEREDGRGAMRAESRAAVVGSERLARILDQRETVPRGELAQRVELARIAEDVDRDDRLRPLRDRRLHGRGIEVQRRRVDVREDRRRALVDEAVRRRGERVRRRDHLVARPDAGDPAEQMQPGRAAGDRGGVRSAACLSEQLLEPLDHRPERQPPGSQHLDDGLLLPLVEVGS